MSKKVLNYLTFIFKDRQSKFCRPKRKDAPLAYRTHVCSDNFSVFIFNLYKKFFLHNWFYIFYRKTSLKVTKNGSNEKKVYKFYGTLIFKITFVKKRANRHNEMKKNKNRQFKNYFLPQSCPCWRLTLLRRLVYRSLR